MFTLPPLPYADDALAPVISANTIGLPLRQAPQGLRRQPEQADRRAPSSTAQPLEEIVRRPAGKADKAGIFNNAAQVWNHTFYWNSLKPNGGGEPPAQLAAKIDGDLRRLRRLQEGVRRRRGDAVRQRLGLARRRRRQAQGRQDRQRRHAAHARARSRC